MPDDGGRRAFLLVLIDLIEATRKRRERPMTSSSFWRIFQHMFPADECSYLSHGQRQTMTMICLVNTNWLIGSAGTLLLDLIMFGQTILIYAIWPASAVFRVIGVPSDFRFFDSLGIALIL